MMWSSSTASRWAPRARCSSTSCATVSRTTWSTRATRSNAMNAWKARTAELSPGMLIAAIVTAQLMGFQKFFGLLTGGAVGICGASAALALSAAFPQHPNKERATLFTVIGVSTLSTLAMVLYPLVVRLLELDALNAGFFLGGTIHDVAQVVGAGYSMGQETGDASTVVKLMRVAMLVPVIAFAAWMTHRHHTQLAHQA